MIILVPMTEPEYSEYVAESSSGYAAEKVASGEWTEEESLGLAQEELNTLLPQGLSTKDNYLFTIRKAPDMPVLGILWYAVRKRAGKPVAYIYDIIINPEHQRKGYATAAMRKVEAEVLRRGLSGISLHVFGHNHAARSLYDKMGFTPSNIVMFKPVDNTSPLMPSANKARGKFK